MDAPEGGLEEGGGGAGIGVDGPHGVDHELGRQVEARGDARLARGTPAVGRGGAGVGGDG